NNTKRLTPLPDNFKGHITIAESVLNSESIDTDNNDRIPLVFPETIELLNTIQQEQQLPWHEVLKPIRMSLPDNLSYFVLKIQRNIISKIRNKQQQSFNHANAEKFISNN